MKNCRCLYCDDKSTDENGKVFIASDRKYSRGDLYWSVCDECLMKCMSALAKEGRK